MSFISGIVLMFWRGRSLGPYQAQREFGQNVTSQGSEVGVQGSVNRIAVVRMGTWTEENRGGAIRARFICRPSGTSTVTWRFTCTACI